MASNAVITMTRVGSLRLVIRPTHHLRQGARLHQSLAGHECVDPPAATLALGY